MRDDGDYLWDGTGEPEPDVEELERALAPLRLTAGAPEAGARSHGAGGARRVGLLLAVAAALLLAVLIPRLMVEGGPEPWTVDGGGSLAVGEWLETDADEALLRVADIGSMTVAPGSRLRLVATGEEQHRLELARGLVSATVLAPPRLLIVETPAADAVDLGCAYTLEVTDAGDTLLWVTSGRVALEAPGRDVLVPAGALAIASAETGPGTPIFTDAPAPLIAAIHNIDGGDEGSEVALVATLSQARLKDTLSLWHLLQAVERPTREAIAARLFELDPLLTTAQLTPEAIAAQEPGALERLRDELEFHWY